MKKFPRLKASLLLGVVIPATCAMAGFPPQFDKGSPPHSNDAPKVRIISPEEGSVFLVGDAIDICANVDHFSNSVASVEFFAGTNILGLVTNSLEDSDVCCLTVSNLVAGDYELTALATDTGGNSITSAVVDISVVTNLPPIVHIFDPQNKAVILGPTNIAIRAAAWDPDGTVASVEFFEGTNSLGVVPALPVEYVTNNFGVFPIKQPFSLTWSNVSLGAYVLTAVAVDDSGPMATSAPVCITVVTDLPPRVRIESPEKGSTYYAPANVIISASASDPDGTGVASVQFFAGTTNLGVVTTPVLVTNGSHVESIYSITWSNVAAGTYLLAALATDNASLTATSGPVKIKVFTPPPPEVIITEPDNHKIFHDAPANINITAFEWNFTNPVVNVQFFAGTNIVGATTSTPLSSIIWSNAPAGAYKLTAQATDSSSLTVTSAPVSITVKTNGSSGHHKSGD